jgi:hypothetical protein
MLDEAPGGTAIFSGRNRGMLLLGRRPDDHPSLNDLGF